MSKLAADGNNPIWDRVDFSIGQLDDRRYIRLRSVFPKRIVAYRYLNVWVINIWNTYGNNDGWGWAVLVASANDGIQFHFIDYLELNENFSFFGNGYF